MLVALLGFLAFIFLLAAINDWLSVIYDKAEAEANGTRLRRQILMPLWPT